MLIGHRVLVGDLGAWETDEWVPGDDDSGAISGAILLTRKARRKHHLQQLWQHGHKRAFAKHVKHFHRDYQHTAPI